MAVYVDPMFGCQRSPNWPWNRACHLFADTTVELHVFAAVLGLKYVWFQDGRFKHFDLTTGMRAKAVAQGAIDLKTRKETIETWHRIDRGLTRIIRKTMTRIIRKTLPRVHPFDADEWQTI